MSVCGKILPKVVLQNNPQKIRNVSLIGDTNHGKTTLFSIFDQTNQPNQPEQKMTIKPNFISRFIRSGEDYQEYLVNLFDTPGHFDLDWEVSSCLRLSDAVVIVIDCTEGVCMQTETLIKRAVEEKLIIFVLVNKLDLLFLDGKFTTEAIYLRLCKIINQVNEIIYDSQQTNSPREEYLSAAKGNVGFASLKQEWGFTLKQFATLYESKTQQSADKIMRNLWGNRFVNSANNKVAEEHKIKNKANWVRGCCKHILEPIKKVFDTCLNDRKHLQSLAQKLGFLIPVQELENKNAEDLIATVMRNWMPATLLLAEIIINQFPSPLVSQKHRLAALYHPNSLEEEHRIQLENCDSTGKLAGYFSQWIAPDPTPLKLLMVGRVFSGSISVGDVVYFVGEHTGSLTVSQIYLNAPQLISIQCAVAGNVIAVHVDNPTHTTLGTLRDDPSALPMKRAMKSNSPTMQQAIAPFKITPIVKSKLSVLNKLMPSTELHDYDWTTNCNSPFHADLILAELKQAIEPTEPIERANIRYCFCETITCESEECLTKSPNKHNRLFGKAKPLNNYIQEAIREEKVNFISSKQVVADLQQFGWHPNDDCIVGFAPSRIGSNVFISHTPDQVGFLEGKESCLGAFKWFSKEGVLADEPVRGFAFHLTNHVFYVGRGQVRNGAQVLPAARRLFYACQLCASPRFMQPIYLMELHTCKASLGAVPRLYAWRPIKEIDYSDQDVLLIGHLPLRHYTDFEHSLKLLGAKVRFMKFAFWEIIESDPLQDGSEANLIAKKIREFKGLDELIPPLDNYRDRL